MSAGNVNFGNSIVRTFSANIRVGNIIADQYVGQDDLVETIANVQFRSTGTYDRFTPILNEQSANIRVINITADQYVGQDSLVETIANVLMSANVNRPFSYNPTSGAILPMITYSVSDGNPIVLFSGQGDAVIPAPTTTQYWTSI